jgi:hypothetical protein
MTTVFREIQGFPVLVRNPLLPAPPDPRSVARNGETLLMRTADRTYSSLIVGTLVLALTLSGCNADSTSGTSNPVATGTGDTTTSTSTGSSQPGFGKTGSSAPASSAPASSAPTTNVVAPPPAPAVSLSVTPSSVAAGNAAKLNWTSTNATACQASGGWSGSMSVNGSQSTGTESAATNFTLVCNGPGGSKTATAKLTVTPAAGNLAVTSPTVLPNATVGGAYSYTLAATGGTPPYSWTIVSATPNTAQWLTTTAAGLFAGLAKTAETETVTAQVTDSEGATAEGKFTITAGVAGSLAVSSPATLPNATNGGAYFYDLAATGGTPPYTWSLTSHTGSTAWMVTPTGWVESAPTTNETDSLTVQVKDSAGNTATGAVSVAVNSTLAVMGQNLAASTSALSLPPAIAGNAYTHTLQAAGGTAPYSYSISSGSLPAGLSLSSSGTVSGTPTAPGSASGVVLRVTDSAGGAATANVAMSIATASKVARPAYNTGSGFFVYNGKVYDPNGYEFRMRGVNRAHFDSATPSSGLTKTGANAVRMFMYNIGVSNSQSATGYATEIQSQMAASKELTILTAANAAGSTTLTSCDTSTADLAATVSWWVANAAAFAPVMNKVAINIANEWGPSASETWATAYESAIVALRAAGYTAPLVIDSGGCGQNFADFLSYSTEVYNADPQKNVIFSLHLYGAAPNAISSNMYSQMASLSATQGMAFIIGEFGPGYNIGPSPTTVAPGQIIQAAESYGIGWLAWAWDDNDLSNAGSDNNWFCMTYTAGLFTAPSSLTHFGLDVALNPVYGLTTLATPAALFVQ